MGVSSNTILLAKQLEGLKGGKPALRPYRDIAGVWTNGYGNTRGVTATTPPITEGQAEADLIQHLREADDVIDRNVTVPLNGNQRGALQLFILNVGEGRPAGAKVGKVGFRDSNLLKLLNQRRYDTVPVQLMRWVKYRNQRTNQIEDSPGLVNRRAAEIKLWTTPMDADLAIQAALQGKPADVPPNPVDVVEPVPPPQPASVLQTSTGKATATAIGTGVAGVIANAKPIADAASAIGGINALNLLQVLGVLFVAGCIAACVWLLWDRSRKVREEGR